MGPFRKWRCFLATITIKNVPKMLHQEIKKRAELHRRSLNNEIIVCLENAVGFAKVDPSQVIAEARMTRAKINVFVTQEQLDKFKSEGRP
jgi:antitoxin FitA